MTRLSLVEGLHVTARQKQLIAYLITEGQEVMAKHGAAHTKSGRLTVTVSPLADRPDHYKARIDSKESDDWGRPVTRTSRVVVKAH